MTAQKNARIQWCKIKGYKSIRDEITITFPEGRPLVLVGENNSGKSNIVSALDLILGEYWPGTREPEDHDFWGRNVQSGDIRIEVGLGGVTDPRTGESIISLRWHYDGNPSSCREKPEYRAKLNNQVIWVNNEIRDQLILILIGPDRRLNYQLSYTSKYTFLSKLMRKFHSALTGDPSRVERLKQAFTELEAIFREVDEFAQFEKNLKDQFGEMFASMSYGLQADFSAYDPSRFFHSLRVVPTEGDSRRTFDELGTGQEQVLALVFAHAYARAFYGGVVLVIEEPEAHLHPLAQRWLAKQIRKMCADGLQVILTTHSPAFIDILGLEGLVLVRKDHEGATNICQLTSRDLAKYCIEHGSHQTKTDESTILPFYAAHATEEILSGFFAKSIVLVEGPTEALALPVYLQRVGLDITQQGIAIIPVMGKGNLAKWWRLFTAYGIPVYIAFDNDTKNDPKGTYRCDALKAIRISDKEISEAINTSEWRVCNQYCVFGNDFETCMRACFGDEYKNLESEAKERFGTDSKPIVARYVADKLSDSNDGWQFIKQLRNVLANTLSNTRAQDPL